uniref:Uncharacterized protein n=1 Tax=Oryza sativa subsp. japonica TaxID=39947 RepID=Q6ZAZ7_ORYSJ|nr:hypothetical protein [Oryza sativa Japonica Group]BAD09772.1 hypothetical protein [Oryza sativa Japonica Group]
MSVISSNRHREAIHTVYPKPGSNGASVGSAEPSPNSHDVPMVELETIIKALPGDSPDYYAFQVEIKNEGQTMPKYTVSYINFTLWRSSGLDQVLEAESVFIQVIPLRNATRVHLVIGKGK